MKSKPGNCNDCGHFLNLIDNFCAICTGKHNLLKSYSVKNGWSRACYFLATCVTDTEKSYVIEINNNSKDKESLAKFLFMEHTGTQREQIRMLTIIRLSREETKELIFAIPLINTANTKPIIKKRYNNLTII